MPPHIIQFMDPRKASCEALKEPIYASFRCSSSFFIPALFQVYGFIIWRVVDGLVLLRKEMEEEEEGEEEEKKLRR